MANNEKMRGVQACYQVSNKIREPNDWRPICSFYIKSSNISDLALFQGLIQVKKIGTLSLEMVAPLLIIHKIY